MAEPQQSRNRTERRSGSNRNSYRRPHFELDPEVSEKLREIEADGEPMSLAESISGAEIRPVTETERKKIEQSEIINVTELQRLSIADLCKQAAIEGVENPEGMNRRDLIFHLLKERVKTRGIMFGEGTLQILPDGFGFLQSGVSLFKLPRRYLCIAQPDSQIQSSQWRGCLWASQTAQGKRTLFCPLARRIGQRSRSLRKRPANPF